jgi:hypothetical protein
LEGKGNSPEEGFVEISNNELELVYDCNTEVIREEYGAITAPQAQVLAISPSMARTFKFK